MVDDATPKRADVETPSAAQTERSLAASIDPGPRALVIVVAVLVLAGSFALPFSPGANGWQILASAPAAVADTITLPSRIFTILAAGFGIILSILSVVTRMWPLALATAAGCTVATVFGLLAIWSRQTIDPASGTPGLGIGLPLAWLTILVLAFNWATIASRRSAQMHEAERARRIAAAEEPELFHYRLSPPIPHANADSRRRSDDRAAEHNAGSDTAPSDSDAGFGDSVGH